MSDAERNYIDKYETKKFYCGNRLGGVAEGGTDDWGEVVTR